MTKQIELTQGQVALVDDDDYQWLSQWKWYFDKHHSGIGGYALRKNKTKKIWMHRAVAEHMGILGRVDHINRNKLDNRRCNLRLATASQDGANRGRRQKKTSKFRGVSWYKPTSCWRAQITTHSIVRHIGYFTDESEAAKAYNREALREFGPFATLNEV